MDTPHPHPITVTPLDQGLRLDQLLLRHLACYSRGQIKALLREGQVELNGRRVTSGLRVAAGDRVVVRSPQALAAGTGPLPDDALPLTVLFEDEALLIVDKPTGMPVHPLRPDEGGTLVNALVARYPELSGFGYHPLQPGLLHRLDNDTSGILVVARRADVFEALRQQFRGQSVLKCYLALVEGAVERDGAVEQPIGHDRCDRRKMLVIDPTDSPPELRRRARPARTLYRVAQRLPAHTLLAVSLRQGMRHQIRAHLAWLGHPIAGDALYGARTVQPVAGLPARYFLHACRIELAHPVRGGLLSADAPLPPELHAWLDRLREAPLLPGTAAAP
jgi:23S rRNA pseudouridine1911/1915/1917 synthase